MWQDFVEIIEKPPDIIEISDDDDKDVIVLNCNDLAVLDDHIAIKEESTPAEPFEAYIASLRAVEAQAAVKQTYPTKGKTKRKIRKKLRRRKANAFNKSAKRTNIANGFPNTVVDEHPHNRIIKQENGGEISIDETKNTNNVSNACESGGNSHNSSTTSRLNTMPPPESPPNQRGNQDYSKLMWLKPLKTLSSPPHLQLVIIDRSHPEWKITNDKWLMIEKRLLETLHFEMLRSDDKSIGLFDGAKWQRGIKIVGCGNEKALNFIKNFVLKLDKLWVGAKLDAFTLSYYAKQICKVFIPPPILNTDVILSLIKLQNPSICSEDWEVLGERKRNYGIDMWLSVNEESLTQLQRLRGEIKYGINRIFVNPVL